MPRKHASNGLTGQRMEAQKADISAATAPRDVPGADVLSPYGLGVYDQLYRARHEWTFADLMLIVQAAQTAQRIDELNKSVPPGMVLVQTTSTVKLHPAITAVTEQRRVLANLLRDASLRQRDGKLKDNKAPKPEAYAAAPEASTGPSMSFDDFYSSLMN